MRRPFAKEGRRGMEVEVAKEGRQQGHGDADGLAGHAGRRARLGEAQAMQRPVTARH